MPRTPSCRRSRSTTSTRVMPLVTVDGSFFMLLPEGCDLHLAHHDPLSAGRVADRDRDPLPCAGDVTQLIVVRIDRLHVDRAERDRAFLLEDVRPALNGLQHARG